MGERPLPPEVAAEAEKFQPNEESRQIAQLAEQLQVAKGLDTEQQPYEQAAAMRQARVKGNQSAWDLNQARLRAEKENRNKGKEGKQAA